MKRLAAAALVLLAFAAPAFADSVTVFAAASLKESLDAAAAAFKARTGHHVAVSYGGSNALARHVSNGAPADLFISADADWMDYADKRGVLVPGSRRDLLANDLVLVAPAASTATVKLAPGVRLAALLGDKRIAIANPDAVPAGKYAKAALTSLGAWDEVKDRIAATGNVRAALILVARGEAPLGVVYRTDALVEKSVKILDTFPAGSHPPIVYPMAQVQRMSPPAAFDFVDYLASAEALAIFQKRGFRAP